MGLFSRFKKEEKQAVPIVEKEELTQEEKRAIREKGKFIELSDLAVKMAADLQIEKKNDGTEIVGIVYNEKSKRAYLFSPGENKLEIGDVVTITDGNGNKRTVMVVVANQYVDNGLLSLPLKEIEDVIFRRKDIKNEEKVIENSTALLPNTKEAIEEQKNPIAVENNEEIDNSSDRNKVLAELGLTEELLAKLESIPDIDDEKLNGPVIEYKQTDEKVNRMVIPGVGAFEVGEDHKLPKVVYVNRKKTEDAYEENE